MTNIENLKAFATALVENFDQDVNNRSNFSKFSFGWADLSEAAEKLGFSELYNSDEFQALLSDYQKRCYILSSETNDKLENGDRKHFIFNWICREKEPYEFTDEEWESDKSTFIVLSETATSFFKIDHIDTANFKKYKNALG